MPRGAVARPPAGQITRYASAGRVSDAWRHCKIIGFTAGARTLLETAQVDASDAGVVDLANGPQPFLDQAKTWRNWDRERRLGALS